MMEEKTEAPSWEGQGLFNPSGRVFHAMVQRLDAVLSMAEALADGRAANEAAALELARQVDRAWGIEWTLRTALRAAESFSGASPAVLSSRNDLFLLSERVTAAASACLARLRALPPGARALEDPEAKAWLGISPEVLDRNAPASRLERNVFQPASDLYFHLRSRMAISVDRGIPGASPARMSFTQAVNVFKHSASPTLRRKTFYAFNSWFADHASLFSDILNAVTGYRNEAAAVSGESIFNRAFREEAIRPETYLALVRALKAAAPAARRTVEVRSELLGLTALHPSAVLCPLPHGSFGLEEHEYPEAYRSLGGLLGAIRRSLGRFAPDFPGFLDEELAGHWIETRRFSGKASGGWCDNLPEARAVAIFSEYRPGSPASFFFTHLVGVALLHHVLQRVPRPRKQIPYTLLETAGMFACVALERELLRETRGTRSRIPVLWQSLVTASNELLYIPFRHALATRIQAARPDCALTSRLLSRMTEESWREYFGDSTEGPDNFAWAYKHHFYRKQPFYDFQYSFGYLLANRLYDELTGNGGRTRAGADVSRFFLDFSEDGPEETCFRHLGADLSKEAFWRETADRALRTLHDPDVAKLREAGIRRGKPSPAPGR
ncbi:MAG: hypothetical protein MR009_10000 [Sutterellaceae bacterium]|nr:hypothetical protein [Sutterellaceae bacterium]MDD7441735.1 hypothetical protein [Sutterellaceae bacterium]MDY2868698.1 hypothetical protein [Mesosutterella sp.]